MTHTTRGNQSEQDAKITDTHTHTPLAKFTLSKVPANNPIREKRRVSSEFDSVVGWRGKLFFIQEIIGVRWLRRCRLHLHRAVKSS